MLIKQLNADNQKMIQAYGFTLTRNYTLVIEKAHIYMEVSAEEAALLKARANNPEIAPEGP